MKAESAHLYTLLSEIFPPVHGGSGRWLYEIYRRQTNKLAIVNEIKDKTILIDANQQDESWIRRIPLSLEETGAFSWSGRRTYRRALTEVMSALEDNNHQCLHAARVLPEGWIAYLHYRKTGTPFLCYAHGEEINLEGRKTSGVMSSRQHRWMAKLAFRATRKIIANSCNTRQMLLDQWGVPPSKVVVMNPGVDASFFCPNPSNQHATAPEQSESGPTLLTVGRLQKRKGQDQVIRALPLIRVSYPNIRYVIAGDGEEREALRRLSRNCNVESHVIWKPNCTDDEILEQYQQCDLFILANRQIGSDVEGFGMVLLEAAACGKATITCDSGGTKEAIEDGVTGVVLKDSNAERIAESICELLADADLRTRFGTAGRQRVMDQYDWNILAKQFRQTVA